MTGLLSRLRLWLATFALCLSLPASAAIVGELPPVDSVFVLSTHATAPGRIEIRWQIADGFYLYRHRTSVAAGPSFANATLALPEGDRHHDEFFGDVQTYRKQLVGVLTGTPGSSTTALRLTVKYQGCADAGVCYPPQTRTLTVALPQAMDDLPPPTFGRKSGGLFALGDAQGATDAAPLPPERAFASEVIALDGQRLLLRLTPAKGYYLYRDKLSVQLDAGTGLATTLPPPTLLPKASPYKDEHFGKVAVYFDQVEIPLPVSRSHARAASGKLRVGLQGCQIDGICYPPMTRTLAVQLPAGTASPSPPPAGERVPKASEGELAPTAPLTPTLSPAGGGEGVEASASAGAALAPSPSRGGEGLATTNDPARETPPQRRTPGLLAALLLALGGGLILNLMPCVLPVLSLKALSLVQSGQNRAHARRHALAYTAGVLASMLALGGLVLALRHAGLALGWGFQLQQPLVLAVLALVMLGLGLSLSGVWQANVALGTRTSALVSGDSARADFFTGALAVVLATPCTAPFMGAALGYAFTGPTAGALLVFLMLGLGLALPFLLIACVPALARLLPRPGAWMDTFKQLLAFPLYASAAWLLWVLTNLRGADAAGLWLAAALLLAFAAWAWARPGHGGARAWQAVAVLALLLIGAPLARLHALPRAQTAPRIDSSDHATWSPQALATLRAQGRPVFLNMTADWCITCKVNEKTVFAATGFQQALAQANAVYMVGDYTDVDPAISAFLQQHKAVGVPLYVVYPRNGGEGRVLPTLLTPGMAEAALREAAR
ncbi:protein-disulfide reductase DsbD family protein [Thermomonas sp.]|uniref:protein-disulfide reductase DsbD family protein n=1 Tax=Thermomonas sp. TaxID=1971895 RepID=UPI0035B0F499